MKKEKVQKLDHGIYRVYWKSGGSSVCTVGTLKDGDKWIRHTNRTNKDILFNKKIWKSVRRMKLLIPEYRLDC